MALNRGLRWQQVYDLVIHVPRQTPPTRCVQITAATLEDARLLASLLQDNPDVVKTQLYELLSGGQCQLMGEWPIPEPQRKKRPGTTKHEGAK